MTTLNVSDDLQENYRTLDLDPGASSDDVRRAYRDLVKVWHPDRFTHDPILQEKAQEKLKRINNAYEQIRKREASASHRKHAPPSDKPESRKKSGAEQRPRTPVPEMGRAWTVPDLGLVLLPMAAGTFTMGSDSIFFRSDEKPVTRVMLTRPFWLGKYQVTQREWNAVMGKNRAKFPGENLPVEMVSWTEAMQFCQKLGKR